MDGFTIFIVCVLIAMFLAFLAIGRWYPGSGADVLDWKPTRSMETEIELEVQDVDEMIEAQNERRRATGRKEITEEGIRNQVAEEERTRRRASEDYSADLDEPGDEPR